MKSGEKNLKLAKEAYANKDIEKALQYAIAADTDFKKTGISQHTAETHALLLVTYYMAGLDDEAFSVIKAMPQQEVSMLPAGKRLNHYLLSAYLYATLEHDTERALAYSDSLKKFHREHAPGDSALIYLDLNNIAEIHAAVGDTATGWALLRYMDDHPKQPASVYSHQLNVNKARLFSLAGKLDSAVKYAKKILEVENNENIDANNRQLAYRILMRSDSLEGNLLGYASKRDSLDHLRYEIQGAHKRHLVASIQGRNRAAVLLNDLKMQRMRQVFWIVVISTVSLAVTGLVVWKYRKRKFRHKIAVLECERLASDVHNLELQCDMLEREVHTSGDALVAMRDEKMELMHQLHKAMSNVASVSPLEHLRLTLYNEHPELMAGIERKCPEISPNDRLILGAIHLGISNKEMAAILSISPSSLLTARYRLRKKLNLRPGTELSDLVARIVSESPTFGT